MSSNRRPRLTPRGETYLAARDLAITMARADTPTSRAWLEGFLDGIRAHDVEAARARDARLAILTARLRKLSPRVTSADIDKLTTMVGELEQVSSNLEEIRRKFGLTVTEHEVSHNLRQVDAANARARAEEAGEE